MGFFTPLVYLVAPNVWVLLLAAAIDGVVTAGIDLLWMFAIMEMAPRQEIAAYTALYNTSVGIRGTTMPFLSGFLLQFIPVRAIFGLAMGSILVSIWLARRLRNTLREIS
jgi:MFS family permease